MKLNKLTLKDKKLFTEFLSLKTHRLSVHAFTNIYIWGGLFEIYWAKILDSLCLFFKDKIGCFLYLSPLSKNQTQRLLKKSLGLWTVLIKIKIYRA